MLSLISCVSPSDNENTELLAKVHRKELYKKDLSTFSVPGNSSADSLLLAENYIKKWVTDELVISYAKHNLSEKQPEIDALVKAYREALLKYHYQEMLVRTKLSPLISEEEMRSYLADHPSSFLLDRSLIKGLFLKIPKNAPNIKGVEKIFRSSDEADLEEIEKYSLQYAANYEYFYDRWVDFGDVVNKLPIKILNPNSYLRRNKFINIQDSTFVYLVNIEDCLLEGASEPFDYAKPKIHEALINERRIAFIRDFENELYNEAILSGDAYVSE
jgi:hypothetical protein